MFTRYAIFYTPPPSGLFDTAARWLGWDSRAGETVQHPGLDGMDVAAITATPRKYGFHGTIKAPFRLAEGQSRDRLETALRDYAQAQPAVTLERLALQADHGFVALRPAAPSPALDALAADVVRHFDPVRAPLTTADIARRRKAGLTPRQDRQMLDWGYPYIFDDFHFHLTLSGRLTPEKSANVIRTIHPLIEPHLAQPYRIEALALMGEDDTGFFHELTRAPLTG